MYVFIRKKGLGNIVTNILIVLIVVVSVAILGFSVIKGTESIGTSVKISECQNLNLGNSLGYKDCLIDKFGVEKASQIIGEYQLKNIEDGDVIKNNLNTLTSRVIILFYRQQIRLIHKEQ